MEKIALGRGLEPNTALGLRPRAVLVSRPRPRAIFSIVHERMRCFNWFIVLGKLAGPVFA